MAQIEYGLYCNADAHWFLDRNGIVFHTDNLGIAIAQRDMCNSAIGVMAYRVGQFPAVTDFDIVDKIQSMPLHIGEADDGAIRVG